jgi:hypothetical protein
VTRVDGVDGVVVGPAHDEGRHERAEELRHDVRHDLRPGEALVDGQGERDGRVEVRPRGAPGDVDAERDAEAPRPVDGVRVAVLARDDLGDDAHAEEDEDGRAGELGQELAEEGRPPRDRPGRSRRGCAL